MPATDVCFVLAPCQNHFFVELVEALSTELEQLGVSAELSRDGFPPLRDGLVYVLVPPHEFRGLAPPSHWPTPRQLRRTIFYCCEQPGTKFFDANVEMGRGPVGAVLDINRKSVEEQRRRGVDAHHAPLGWTPAWTFADPTADPPPPGALERDVDLLHLGIHSERRGAALARSADLLARRRTALVLGDDHAPNSAAQPNFAIGREKWELLARSRVLLNIHVGDRPYFEWLRVVQAICNGVFVVSEHSQGTSPLRAGEHFASGAPDELVELAEPYLEDEPRRAAAARGAFECLRAELPFSASAGLLAELAHDVARRASPHGIDDDAPAPWPDNAGIREEVRRAASAAPASAGDAALAFADGDHVLGFDPDVELLPTGLTRLTAALEQDRGAAFAWGMIADEGPDGSATLSNVFPWQPWRLESGGFIERPVLWRTAALHALGGLPDIVGSDDGGDLDLYRRAAGHALRGAHIPEIVARRRAQPLPSGASSVR